ncbi:hypothetical protein WG947_12985 [Pontibacter sp. H259]|uniref:hypothetical protein n=1 Tax=Pontibacter sp. H259 TaxID=3133421 RepID=UPI0030C3AFE6
MKKSSCGVILTLLLAVLCLSCQKDEPVSPHTLIAPPDPIVIGLWKVGKIEYKVCRKGSCSVTNYSGNTKDYFEFRTDSAFLSYKTAADYRQLETFKADYYMPGSFTLTQGFWTAQYLVKEYKVEKLVLECSYMGSDPYAVFTDTYYLYR